MEPVVLSLTIVMALCSTFITGIFFWEAGKNVRKGKWSLRQHEAGVPWQPELSTEADSWSSHAEQLYNRMAIQVLMGVLMAGVTVWIVLNLVLPWANWSPT